MLSIIIPSYRDPLLMKTIDSLLMNAGGDIEIIAVLDGYWPTVPLPTDKRVRIIHHGQNKGMREAINTGVRAARGEYIMRTDEHCVFGDRYDLILTHGLEDNWIVTPLRYFLDPVRWAVMDLEPVGHMKLAIVHFAGTRRKFSGVNWKKPFEQPIEETMAMQGSCWLMKKKWWEDVIGELQTEGYDTHYQDSHEMVFKTWKAGGKLMVNKNTWYAHKHRSFPRTHGYGGDAADKCFAYALSVWEDYYTKEIVPKWGI